MGEYTEQGYHFGQGLTAPEIERRLNMVPYFSRPNLIHNWCFGICMVDQRNGNGPEYTIGNSTTKIHDSSENINFWADRWKMVPEYPNTKVKINRYTISIEHIDEDTMIGTDADHNIPLIRQTIYYPYNSTSMLCDCDIAFTILYEDGTLVTTDAHTGENKSQWSCKLNDDNGCVAAIYCNGSVTGRQGYPFYIELYKNKPMVAIKLELGHGQTLAKYISGKWVLNDAYDYNKEFEICKKFYQIVSLPISIYKILKSKNINYTNHLETGIEIVLNGKMIANPSLAGISRMGICDDKDTYTPIVSDAGANIVDGVTLTVSSTRLSIGGINNGWVGGYTYSYVLHIIIDKDSNAVTWLTDGEYVYIKPGSGWSSVLVALSADI